VEAATKPSPRRVHQPSALEIEMTKEGEVLLSKVEAMATQRARAKITAKFCRADCLEEIDTWAPVLRQRLEIAEVQLRTAMYGKLFSLKRVDDYVTMMGPALEELRTRFTSVRELCERGGVTFRAYRRLRRVGLAQRNLTKTLNIIALFSDIPIRAEKEVQKLQASTGDIEVVCSQVQAMEQWRDDIIHHLKKLRDKKNKESADAREGKSGPAESLFAMKRRRSSIMGGLQVAEPDPEELLDVLAGHFDSVLTLSTLLRKKVTDAALEVAELATADPAYLRKVGRVVVRLHEVEERKKRIEIDRIREAHGEEHAQDYEAMMASRDVLETFSNHLAEGATLYVVSRYAKHLYESAQEGIDDDVSTTIRSCTFVYDDVDLLADQISGMLPEGLQAPLTFFNACQKHVVLQLSRCYHKSVVDGLSPGQLLALIEYVEEYNRTEVERSRAACSDFVQASQQLLNVYLDKTKVLMVSWFENMHSTRREQRTEGPSGELATSFPEDFFHALHVMLQVAKQKLGGIQLSLVIRDCLQVLEEHQTNETRELAAEADVGVSYLCRVVNDNDRLQQKCDEYLDDMRQFLAAEVMPAMEEFVEDLSSQLVQSSLRVINIILERIFQDMQEMGVQQGLFTPGWVSGQEEIIPTVIFTLLDYAGDLKTWLLPFYFMKFLHMAVLQCCQLTLDAFPKAGPVAEWAFDRKDVAARIESDAVFIKETIQASDCAYALAGFDLDGHLAPVLHLASELRNDDSALVSPKSTASEETNKPSLLARGLQHGSSFRVKNFFPVSDNSQAK